MSYSNLYLRANKNPPLYLVVMSVMVVIGFAAFFLKTERPTQAAKITIRNLEIVNPTATQMGLFWQTDKKEVSWIIYGDDETQFSRTSYDERDIKNDNAPHLYHYAVMKNLQPGKKYYYRVIIGNAIAQVQGNSTFTFITPLPGTNSDIKPAYGKIILPNGQPSVDTFVLVRQKSAFPLLTLTKVTGEFLVPLQTVVDKSTMRPLYFKDSDTIELQVFDESMTVSVVKGTINKIQPLPQSIILGKAYTFIDGEDVLSATSQISPAQIVPTQTKEPIIDIIYPKENSIIPGQRPLIKGNALANQEIVVVLDTKPETIYTVKSDNNGVWKVNITQDLPAGSHVLTINSLDQNGKKTVIKRKYSIALSGNQVLGDSTGSAAKATPTKTPPTPTPTTVAITSPVVSTSVVSSTPTPIQTSPTTSVTPIPPQSGIDTLPFTLVSIGLVVIGIGLIFVF